MSKITLSNSLLLGIVFSVLLSPLVAFADPVAIIIHKNNQQSDITLAELGKIYRGERTRWRDGQKIFVINREIGSNVRRDFNRVLFNLPPDKRTYFREDVTGDTIAGADDEQVIELVSKLSNAIGYIASNHAGNDHVKVITVDGFKPIEAGYPIK